MNYFKEAVKIVGTQDKMAEALGINQAAVSQIVTGHKPIPPARCRHIEFLTRGKITRYQLRPDIFGASAKDKIIYEID